MFTNASELPSDILFNIFSYLQEPRDLRASQQVCRSWNAVMRTDAIWKHHSQVFLNHPELLADSSEEQYGIIHRWVDWQPKKRSLTFAYDGDPFHLFLSKGNLLRATFHKENPAVILVFNLEKNEEICRIDLASYGCGELQCWMGHGTTAGILDTSGKIFLFNTLTGECCNKIDAGLLPPQNGFTLIEMSDRDVMRYTSTFGGEPLVQIWDLKKIQAPQTYTIPENHQIYGVNSTANFLILNARNIETRKEYIVALNKRDLSLQDPVGKTLMIDDQFGDNWWYKWHFACTEDYCCLVTMKGDLHVYQDRSSELQLVQSIKLSVDSDSTPLIDERFVQIFQNWVFVKYKNLFRVFDVRTGANIVSREWNDKSFVVDLNCRALAVSHDVFSRQHKCDLYDFSPSIRQLSKDCGTVQ